MSEQARTRAATNARQEIASQERANQGRAMPQEMRQKIFDYHLQQQGGGGENANQGGGTRGIVPEGDPNFGKGAGQVLTKGGQRIWVPM